MKYTSNAEWPVTVSSQLGHSMTTDTHDTEEQAQGVCKLLRRHGFGGNHEVYPIRTWFEAVSPKGDQHVVEQDPLALTVRTPRNLSEELWCAAHPEYQPMPKASQATGIAPQNPHHGDEWYSLDHGEMLLWQAGLRKWVSRERWERYEEAYEVD